MKLKIKKGSTIQVIAGAEKGKQGKVMEINEKALKVRVEGLKIMTHFDKKEGIQKREGFFDYSNVKLVDAPVAPPAKKKAAKKTKARQTA
jgi:large subunit ribosomal protein L24